MTDAERAILATEGDDVERDTSVRVTLPGLGTIGVVAPPTEEARWRELVEGAWREADQVPERFLDALHAVLHDHWSGPIVLLLRREGWPLTHPHERYEGTYPGAALPAGAEECDES